MKDIVEYDEWLFDSALCEKQNGIAGDKVNMLKDNTGRVRNEDKQAEHVIVCVCSHYVVKAI